MAFSPDGKRLASGNAEVKVWDAQTGRELLTLDHNTRPVPIVAFGVAFSPDGNRLASVSFDNTVVIWDAQSGRKLPLSEVIRI